MVVEDHALEQTAADALRNRPLDLPAALHGVEDRSGVRGVDALQDANFSGDPIHGDTKAMHVEAGGARRPVSFAHHAQPMPRVGHGLEQLGQRDAPRAAFHRAIHEAALPKRSGGELAGDLEHIVAQIFGGEAHGFAGHTRADAGKGARIVSRLVRVRDDDFDATGGGI